MENRYQAYLLRLWQVDDGQSAVWRASLENAHSGDRRAFANRQELLAFLEDLAPDQPSPETASPPAEALHGESLALEN
ncbi:MAG: hypothetical protein ACYC5M_09945 [Anaerolineae bacterium]